MVLTGSLGVLRQPKPQRVHRRAELLDRKPGADAHGRNDGRRILRQVGADLIATRRDRQRARRSPGPLLDELAACAACADGMSDNSCLLSEKIQEIHCGISARNLARVGR